jgi:hypothetical protein
MDQMFEAITYYRLVVKDITSGRKRPCQDQEAIRGRYPAEAVRDRLQRENRNPSLQYELERTTAPAPKEAGSESTILDHHFERKW